MTHHTIGHTSQDVRIGVLAGIRHIQKLSTTERALLDARARECNATAVQATEQAGGGIRFVFKRGNDIVGRTTQRQLATPMTAQA